MSQRRQVKHVDDLKKTPHSIEAEQSVLGGLLIDNLSWQDVSEHIIKEDFYLYSHRLIFGAMHALFEDNQPVDLITVSEYLEARNELDPSGGFTYLLEIQKNVPSAANIVRYADIVREYAVIREMIGVANSIVESGYETKGRSSADLIDEAESKIFAIAEKRAKKNEGPVSVQSIVGKAVARIKEATQSSSDITGVDTGFVDLNKMTLGLQKADLVIVAGRPSMGKTTFAMNLAEHASFHQDKPVLVFSLEMPSEQIILRMISSLSRVDQTNVRSGKLTEEDWVRVSGTLELLNKNSKLFIDDGSSLTPTEVRSRARRIHREHGGLSMILIDYLQLMTVPGMHENRTLEIAEISRSLKALAKELDCPVVALSQLNRSLEQRSDKRPVNSDLRESGSIEQDADLIMFIYRDEVYHPETEDKGLAEIIIGKQRNGPIGSIKVKFNGSFSRFDNYAGNRIEDF